MYFGSLDGGAPKRLIAAETAAAFAPQHYLLVVRRAFSSPGSSITRGEVGDSIPVAEPVGSDQAARRSAFSVSAAGVLAHRARSTSHRQLVWLDRTGAQVGMLGPPDDSILQNPTLDHAGRRVAVQRTVQGNFDIWVQEIGRSLAARFTFDPGIDGVPIWSATRLVFLDPNGCTPYTRSRRARRGGCCCVREKRFDGLVIGRQLHAVPKH